MNDLIEGVKITGKLDMDGTNIYGNIDVADLRIKVGMVFQKPNPFPMSIYENVAYGLRAQGIKDKKHIDDVVERSLRGAALWDEVKDRLKSHAFGLSGGQQQRLCIARTIAMEPDVILMDEPTSALDPIATHKIEELMEELKKKLHNCYRDSLHAASSSYLRPYGFLPDGRLVEHDDTQVIFSEPKDDRTKGYVNGDFG